LQKSKIKKLPYWQKIAQWQQGDQMFLGKNCPKWNPTNLFIYFGSATPCASPPPRPSILFWLLIVNRDDWNLLAHAMASDFSVTWQCLSKRTIGFFPTDKTLTQLCNLLWYLTCYTLCEKLALFLNNLSQVQKSRPIGKNCPIWSHFLKQLSIPNFLFLFSHLSSKTMSRSHMLISEWKSRFRQK
jgi:hypothetical protein